MSKYLKNILYSVIYILWTVFNKVSSVDPQNYSFSYDTSSLCCLRHSSYFWVNG